MVFVNGLKFLFLFEKFFIGLKLDKFLCIWNNFNYKDDDDEVVYKDSYGWGL